MDESGTYGHFGQAVYDHEESEWRFERSSTTPNSLQPLGGPKVVISGQESKRPPALHAEAKEGPSRRRENQLKALVKAYPELQPASELLPDLARVSEGIERTTDRHDPAKGNLLVFGTITDELTRHRVQVAAFPTGVNGCDLRVVEVKPQARGWQGSRNTYLRVPTIYGEEATWTGPGAPIQSVTFAMPLETGNTFLAVRLITETYIFRPILRSASVSNGSRLDLSPMLCCNVNQSASSPHADIAFNPWYSRQFAALQQGGSWSVCEMTSIAPVKISQLCSNFTMNDSDSGASAHASDLWGRVVWVCGPSTLAICDRRNVALFDVANNTPVQLQKLNTGLEGALGWILDMIVVQSQPNFLVILTSFYLVLYHVQSGEAEGIEVMRAAQIRHHRNAEDISLRVHCSSIEEDVLLFIRSDFDTVVLVFRLRVSSATSTIVDDPFELTTTHGGNSEHGGASALFVHRVATIGDLTDASDGRIAGDDTRNCYCFQVTQLNKDLSVTQTLHHDFSTGNDLEKRGAPTWEGDLTKSARKVLGDDFIVDDDEEETGQSRVEPVSNYAKRLEAQKAAAPDKWTLNYELTVRRLHEVDVADVTVVQEVLEEAKNALNWVRPQESLPFRTLRELATEEITVQDLQSASTQLQELLRVELVSPSQMVEDEMEGKEQSERSTIHSITLPSNFSLPGSKAFDNLRAMRENISKTWIGPLPTGVSDIVRLSKEQLAARMAVEASLAGLIIRPPDVEEGYPPERQTYSQGQSQSEDQFWDLPVRPGASPSSRATPSIYLDAASQPRSPMHPGSMTSVPSSPRSSSHVSASNTAAVARLNHYTTFAGKPSPARLSRRMNRVLDHWAPGTDPSSYDWLSASKHFSRLTRCEDEEAEGAEMTEKERLRLQRRTERYVRRQQREAEEAQRQQMLGSQVPTIASGSQPTVLSRANSQLAPMAPIAESQSQSQSQNLGQMVASQVLPGRHGGRPPAKKKRKSGF